MELEGALRRALAARDAGDDAELLRALLAAWRACPDPELALLIDDVSLRLERVATRGFGQLDPKHARRYALRGLDELNAPWRLALIAADRWTPADVAPLVDFPPDPRIAATLPRLAWTTTVKAVLAKVPALRAHLVPARRVPETTRPAHAQLTADVVARARAERVLLEQVWAEPDDDGPRQVYADLLLERAHPHGELIALQLAQHRGAGSEVDERQIYRLLARFAHVWSGPIASACSYVLFERGFPATATLAEGLDLAAVTGQPEWSTVHRLDLHAAPRHAPAELVAFLVHPTMRALRAVSGVDDDRFHALAAAAEPLRVRELFLSLRRAPTPGEHDIAAGGRALPELRRVVCTGAVEQFGWLLRGALATRLEILEVSAPGRGTVAWLAAALACCPGLQRLVVHEPGERFVVEDRVLAINSTGVAPVRAVLDELPGGLLEGVRLEGATRAFRSDLAPAARRHGGLVD